MLKKFFHSKRYLGVIIISVGIGIIAAVIIPVWGLLIAVGCGLIYVGWCFIKHC